MLIKVILKTQKNFGSFFSISWKKCGNYTQKNVENPASSLKLKILIHKKINLANKAANNNFTFIN